MARKSDETVRDDGPERIVISTGVAELTATLFPRKDKGWGLSLIIDQPPAGGNSARIVLSRDTILMLARWLTLRGAE